MNPQTTIVKLGSDVLRTPVEPIEEITDRHVHVVNTMKFALHRAQGYGLAAPQLGFSLPIFVYLDGSVMKPILNPQLGEYDSRYWCYDEGCLSIPGFAFPIWRPEHVMLRGIDINGETVKIDAHGILARIFQHEMDHLNGKLVIDHLSPEELAEFQNAWKARKPKPTKKKKRK